MLLLYSGFAQARPELLLVLNKLLITLTGPVAIRTVVQIQFKATAYQLQCAPQFQLLHNYTTANIISPLLVTYVNIGNCILSLLMYSCIHIIIIIILYRLKLMLTLSQHIRIERPCGPCPCHYCYCNTGIYNYDLELQYNNNSGYRISKINLSSHHDTCRVSSRNSVRCAKKWSCIWQLVIMHQLCTMHVPTHQLCIPKFTCTFFLNVMKCQGDHDSQLLITAPKSQLLQLATDPLSPSKSFPRAPPFFLSQSFWGGGGGGGPQCFPTPGPSV